MTAPIKGPETESGARQGWRAELALGFVRSGRRTVLGNCRHRGPLAVQRPFYPDDGVCHLYLLHPPGGLVGGDTLDIEIGVEKGAEALLTTPGATKFYRSMGPLAVQRQKITVAAGAMCEWLPQENIVFPGANASLATEIELQKNSRFMGWEISCLGLPVIGERFTGGRFASTFSLRIEGVPLLFDRLRIGSEKDLDRPTGLRGFPVCATFVATGISADMLPELRALPLCNHPTVGLTLIDGILVARFLGDKTEEARRCFQQIWAWLRPRVFGVKASVPRIWAT